MENSNQKNKIKILSLTPQMWDAVLELQNKYMARNPTEAIYMAIREAHNKNFPSYVKVQQERNKKTSATPEEKMASEAQKILTKEEAKKEAEKLKLEKKLNEGRAICSRIWKSKEITDYKGYKRCAYTAFDYANPATIWAYKEEPYMDEMEEEMVEKQFWNTIKNSYEDPLRIMEGLKQQGRIDENGEITQYDFSK